VELELWLAGGPGVRRSVTIACHEPVDGPWRTYQFGV